MPAVQRPAVVEALPAQGEEKRAVLEQPPARGLVRDALMWQGFLLYGFWSFVWCLFGPIMPPLRAELGIDYGTAALHFSALALGPLMAGFTGHRIIESLGRARTVWIGISVVVLGICAVMAGVAAYVTIFGAWLIGAGGSHAGQAIVATSVDRSQGKSAQVISEVNIVGAMFSLMAPISAGACFELGLPWRATMILSVVMLAAICLITRKAGVSAVDRRDEASKASSGKLPLSYWLYFSVIFFSVAAEWSVTFWCPEFLEKIMSMSPANACAGLSALIVTMLAGRLLGRRLTDFASTNTLLAAATSIAVAGFVIFWLSNNVYVTMVGLVLFGLGEANVYPLALAAAIASPDRQSTLATVRMSLSTGSAILLAPLALGLIADKVGIFKAYGLVAALLVIAAMLAFYVGRRCAGARQESMA